MYGGASGPNDRLAMKSAKNERDGVEALNSVHIHQLKSPIYTFMDYKGYRIIAMSIAPIGKDTLRYGSNDSGRTIHTDDEKINSLMKDLAAGVNLRGHMTGQGSNKKVSNSINS